MIFVIGKPLLPLFASPGFACPDNTPADIYFRHSENLLVTQPCINLPNLFSCQTSSSQNQLEITSIWIHESPRLGGAEQLFLLKARTRSRKTTETDSHLQASCQNVKDRIVPKTFLSFVIPSEARDLQYQATPSRDYCGGTIPRSIIAIRS